MIILEECGKSFKKVILIGGDNTVFERRRCKREILNGRLSGKFLFWTRNVWLGRIAKLFQTISHNSPARVMPSKPNRPRTHYVFGLGIRNLDEFAPVLFRLGKGWTTVPNDSASVNGPAMFKRNFALRLSTR